MYSCLITDKLRIVLEYNTVGQAHDVGHEEVGDDHRKPEVDFDGAEVAGWRRRCP